MRAGVRFRQQVLPKETLLEVFDWSKRVDLDQCGTVSRQYDATVQSAQPLREVTSVLLKYDFPKKLYEATFYPKEARNRGRKHLTSDNMNDLLETFFSCLRFCSVTVSMHIHGVPIDGVFVERLRDVRKHFVCEGRQLKLTSPELAAEVDVIELLRSFPCFRSISTETLRFLDVDDVLLGKLSSLGVRETGVIDHRDGLRDKAVLDFLFANCEEADGPERRRFLELHGAEALSSQFCTKLVTACRECTGNHPFEMYLAFTTHFDLQQFAEQVPQDFLHWPHSDDGRPIWQYRFDDPDGLEVKISNNWVWYLGECAALHAFRHCTPTRSIPVTDKMISSVPYVVE